MNDENYITDPKDFRDINFNVKLLVEKFNHEHTLFVEKIAKIEKKTEKIENIENKVIRLEEIMNSNGRWLKLIGSIIGALGTLIGIGAVLDFF